MEWNEEADDDDAMTIEGGVAPASVDNFAAILRGASASSAVGGGGGGATGVVASDLDDDSDDDDGDFDIDAMMANGARNGNGAGNATENAAGNTNTNTTNNDDDHISTEIDKLLASISSPPPQPKPTSTPTPARSRTASEASTRSTPIIDNFAAILGDTTPKREALPIRSDTSVSDTILGAILGASAMKRTPSGASISSRASISSTSTPVRVMSSLSLSSLKKMPSASASANNNNNNNEPLFSSSASVADADNNDDDAANDDTSSIYSDLSIASAMMGDALGLQEASSAEIESDDALLLLAMSTTMDTADNVSITSPNLRESSAESSEFDINELLLPVATTAVAAAVAVDNNASPSIITSDDHPIPSSFTPTAAKESSKTTSLEDDPIIPSSSSANLGDALTLTLSLQELSSDNNSEDNNNEPPMLWMSTPTAADDDSEKDNALFSNDDHPIIPPSAMLLGDDDSEKEDDNDNDNNEPLSLQEASSSSSAEQAEPEAETTDHYDQGEAESADDTNENDYDENITTPSSSSSSSSVLLLASLANDNNENDTPLPSSSSSLPTSTSAVAVADETTKDALVLQEVIPSAESVDNIINEHDHDHNESEHEPPLPLALSLSALPSLPTSTTVADAVADDDDNTSTTSDPIPSTAPLMVEDISSLRQVLSAEADTTDNYNYKAPSSQDAHIHKQESPTKSKSEKKFTAPEPPRWRFVNVAKKSDGYSSSSAGMAVKGLSAEELASTYRPENWKASKKSDENILQEDDQDADEGAQEKKENVVGKLVLDQLDVFEENDVVEETFEGTFGGFHNRNKHHEDEDAPVLEDKPAALEKAEEEETVRDAAKEEKMAKYAEEQEEVAAILREMTFQVEKKDVEEDAKEETEMVSQVEKEDAKEEKEGSAEPLVIPSLPLPPSPKEEIEVVEDVLSTTIDDELDRVEKQVVAISSEEETVTVLPTPQKSEDGFEDEPSVADEKDAWWKRRKWPLLLLLLLLVVIMAIVGAVVGGGDKSEEMETIDRAVDRVDVISGDVIDNVTVAPTNAPTPGTPAPVVSLAPTSAPSSSPTPYCPANTKLFSVSHSNGENNSVQQPENEEVQFTTWAQTTDENDNEQWQQAEGPVYLINTATANAGINTTWVVRDACSGEEMLSCLPCSAHVSSQPSTSPSSLPSFLSLSSKLFDDTITMINPPNSTCVPDDRPRPIRDGIRFRFNLLHSNGKSGECIDQLSRPYEWGSFLLDEDENFGDCAERCVMDVPDDLVLGGSLAFGSHFRGIDFNCATRECRCLYDEGTLTVLNSGDFVGDSYDDGNDPGDLIGESGAANGPVLGIKEMEGRYCGDLVDQEDVSQRLLQETKLQSGVVANFVASEDGVSGCLPVDKEYVFEVKPTSGEGCCGFVPESFVALYDDIVLRRGDWPEGKDSRQTNNSDDAGNGNGNSQRSLAQSSKTYFGEASEPCKTSIPSLSPSNPPPSTMPSIHPTITGTYDPTQSPVTPMREVPLDTSVNNLCREVIDSEMAGRVPGMTCKWCGFCQWKRTGFNCYQRMQFLMGTYGTGQLEGREALCNLGQCVVPEEGVSESIQLQIDSISECGDVPVVEEPEPEVTVKVATSAPTSPPTQPTTSGPTPTLSYLPSSSPSAEPHSNPSSQPTFEFPQTDTPTLLPTFTSTIPAEEPTNSPTEQIPKTANPTTLLPTLPPTPPPTARPTTPSPTTSPTDKPTCDEEYDDFNMCIAIDMSGSVCNQGTGFECIACEPELICNDIGIDKATCCTNFYDVVEFAKNMISTLASISNTDQSYSVVGFGTNATTNGETTSTPAQTLEILDQLIYTGGRTNHADAINACRASIASSPLDDPDKANIMLLITDGEPSEPQGSPQADAEEAAAEAKDDGIFIIPVMIVPQFTAYVPSMYLQGISSDGVVFDVDDFAVLDSLRDNLLAQVSCQV